MMAMFRYVGPRTLRGAEVDIEIPGRSFRTNVAGTISTRKRRAKEALDPDETRRGTCVKNLTTIRVPNTDTFLAKWFRLARSVEGLALFQEIP